MTILQGNDETLSAGSWVYTDQGVASDKGFNHVSKYWYPQTISFDDGIEQIETLRKTREDITAQANATFFTSDGKDIAVNIDGRQFKPTEWSFRQLCNWYKAPQALYNFYMVNPKRTESDVNVVLTALENGKKKLGQSKKLVYRTYNDGTLRAVLSQKYSTVDNVWYLELLKKYIPGGRLSHWKGDADTLYGNVLIPDTIREESDSDYGGMLSVSNSEIGRRIISQLPSIFRAICMNGCVWGQTKGDILSKRHVGIQLDWLRERIRNNIHSQIPLLTTAVPMLIDTHSKKVACKMSALFAAISKRYLLPSNVMVETVSQWQTHSREQTLFGAIDAVTRAGQQFDNDVWVKCDTVGGQLMSGNWDSLNGFANTLSEKEIGKVFGVAI